MNKRTKLAAVLYLVSFFVILTLQHKAATGMFHPVSAAITSIVRG